jgi:D-arabinose 1-dehydrogenase-like Zn-dependent alcohol dehydrogenase
MIRLLQYSVLGVLCTAARDWVIQNPVKRVAVVGLGASGHLGIQYSKATCFETIAIRHSKDKKELACKFGAERLSHMDKDC